MYTLGSLAPREQYVALWQELKRGVESAKHPFHTLTLATVRHQDGAVMPIQRTVVLRDANSQERTVFIHSDRRSPKIADLRENAAVSLLFYDAVGRWQLVLAGVAAVHDHDSVADDRWITVAERSRACYRTPHAPSSILDEGSRTTGNSAVVNFGGREAFSVISVQIHTLEALFLDHAGHLRRRWNCAAGDPIAVDLAP